VVALDSRSGELVTRKVPSTPREPERGVLDGLEALMAQYPRGAATIEFLGHSTTIATNALLGQMGLELPRVAIVTTHGFRDLIEIGRQNRSDVYDLFVERPRPLVAREDRLTVRERIDYRGNVLEPLDEAALARACEGLRARDGIAAVAVCLLNSYVNDRHERRVAEAIAEALPSVTVVRSSAIDPQYREYERFSTTVVNAALSPIVARYLDRLSRELRAREMRQPLYVMRSDGGLTAAERAAARPASIIESGPASGVIAVAALGNRLGLPRLLSFDMGGTTAKAGAIVDGIAQVAGEFEAAGKTHSGRAIRGSGYPVRFPFVDLAEVSAGGGTIAWIDGANALRVGPISAGADPGPACYGSSDRATVTDANVVLGRLNQRHLLGGAYPIDSSRARLAVAALARQLGLGVEETAAGIVTLIDAHMSKALRIVTIERGLDPRDFTMAAFGGGGPLHACALADELGITRVVVPEHPGVFSAYGLLVADVRESFVHPILQELEQTDFTDLANILTADETRGRQALVAQGVASDAIGFRREFDARYVGQSFELTIAYDGSRDALAERFHSSHRARYGYDARGERIELVNARLTAFGLLGAQGSIANARAARSPQPPSQRRLWCGEAFVPTPVFPRDALAAGARVEGPAIVEEYDSSTYLAAGWSLTVREELLMLERNASAS
jgi:N-methylhydantoinase A